MDDLKIVRKHAAIRNVKENGTEKSVPNGTKVDLGSLCCQFSYVVSFESTFL
jgi:hypothetical protein